MLLHFSTFSTRLPGFEDHGIPLFESGAMLMYLAQQYSGKPQYQTPEGRAEAAKWVSFANTSLQEVLFHSENELLFNSPVEERRRQILERKS
jgi:glutathione S-transferase